METDFFLGKVGDYTIKQMQPEDCSVCHNAKWATILLREKESNEYICLECLLAPDKTITVWTDGTWKCWRGLDAEYAAEDPNWLVNIPLRRKNEPNKTTS